MQNSETKAALTRQSETIKRERERELEDLTGLVSLIVIIELGVNTFPINKTNHGIELRFSNLFAFKRKQDSQ